MTIYPLTKFGKALVYPALCIIGVLTCLDIVAFMYILFCYHEQDKWMGIIVLALLMIVGVFLFVLIFIRDLKYANMSLSISAEGITVFYKKLLINTFFWSDLRDYGVCHIYNVNAHHTNKMLYFSKQILTDQEKIRLDTCANEKMICLRYNESLHEKVQMILSKDFEVYYYTRKH